MIFKLFFSSFFGAQNVLCLEVYFLHWFPQPHLFLFIYLILFHLIYFFVLFFIIYLFIYLFIYSFIYLYIYIFFFLWGGGLKCCFLDIISYSLYTKSGSYRTSYIKKKKKHVFNYTLMWILGGFMHFWG